MNNDLRFIVDPLYSVGSELGAGRNFTVTRSDGATYKGYEYYSRRTVPGKWVGRDQEKIDKWLSEDSSKTYSGNVEEFDDVDARALKV